MSLLRYADARVVSHFTVCSALAPLPVQIVAALASKAVLCKAGRSPRTQIDKSVDLRVGVALHAAFQIHWY